MPLRTRKGVGKCNYALMAKGYQGEGGGMLGGMPGGMPGVECLEECLGECREECLEECLGNAIESDEGPKIEEVD